VKAHWTKAAEAHLDAIYAYIAQDSTTYALRMVERITRRSQQIGKLPLSGRKVPEDEKFQNMTLIKSGKYSLAHTESYITSKPIKLT